MQTLELGQKMVEMVNQGRDGESIFVSDFYADSIVSIEGQGSEEMPARMEGIEAIRGKHAWWYDNNEVHESVAHGPYFGHREDQFILRFTMDITPQGGERMQMDEIGVYTVNNGKIVQEEYLYSMA